MLFPAPSLWTRADFTMSTKSQQQLSFANRGTTSSTCPFPPTRFEHLLESFLATAPELKHLEIQNSPGITEIDLELPPGFGGQMSKLTSLSLAFIHISGFEFPSKFTSPTSTRPDQPLHLLVTGVPSRSLGNQTGPAGLYHLSKVYRDDFEGSFHSWNG